MASLAETNPYLRDRKKMLEMIAAFASEWQINEWMEPTCIAPVGSIQVHQCGAKGWLRSSDYG